MDYLGLHQLPCGLTFRAAMTGNPEMVKLVLQAGSMVDERDMFGRTALHACTQPHRLAGGREFYEVCDEDQLVCVVQVLLEADAALNMRDNENATPLLLAIESGYNQVAQLLLQYRANPLIRDARGISALSQAIVSNCSSTLMEELLHQCALN